jgi:hypothetical protein
LEISQPTTTLDFHKPRNLRGWLFLTNQCKELLAVCSIGTGKQRCDVPMIIAQLMETIKDLFGVV